MRETFVDVMPPWGDNVYRDLANLTSQLEEALAERPPTLHDPGCSGGISTLPCKCSHKDTAAALAACEEFMEKYSHD